MTDNTSDAINSDSASRRPRGGNKNNGDTSGEHYNHNGRTSVRSTGGLKTLEIYPNKGQTSNFYDFKKEFVIHVFTKYKECGHTFNDGATGLYFPPAIKKPSQLKRPTKQKVDDKGRLLFRNTYNDNVVITREAKKLGKGYIYKVVNNENADRWGRSRRC
jgi:hypothetical protein